MIEGFKKMKSCKTCNATGIVDNKFICPDCDVPDWRGQFSIWGPCYPYKEQQEPFDNSHDINPYSEFTYDEDAKREFCRKHW